jgi:hypothetical protein
MRYLKSGIALLVAVGLSTTAAYAHPRHRTSVQSDMSKTYAMMNHNTTQSSARGFDWTKYITVSGLLNVDATYTSHGWNDVVPGYIPSFQNGAGEGGNVPHASDIAVNNANLLFDVRINHFTTAHVGLVYHDRVGPNVAMLKDRNPGDTDDCYDTSRFHSPVEVDEAYITLANFSREPFYVRAGREFVPFGTYDSPYPITYSLPQLLSQLNATAVQFGYATSNMHLAVYGFNGVMSGAVRDFYMDESSRVRNYGVQLAYMGSYKDVAYHADIGFIRDIRDATFNAASIIETTPCDNIDEPTRRAAGFSAHVDMTRGPFDFTIDYVSALRDIVPGYDSRGWAYALLGGYTFHTYNYMSKVNVGYQRAGQIDTILPKYRILADYNIVLGRHTEATVQYVHNKDFNAGSTASDAGHEGQSANVVNLRLGVHF